MQFQKTTLLAVGLLLLVGLLGCDTESKPPGEHGGSIIIKDNLRNEHGVIVEDGGTILKGKTSGRSHLIIRRGENVIVYKNDQKVFEGNEEEFNRRGGEESFR